MATRTSSAVGVSTWRSEAASETYQHGSIGPLLVLEFGQPITNGIARTGQDEIDGSLDLDCATFDSVGNEPAITGAHGPAA